MEHNTYVHRKQADALETYWESQNEKVKMLEQFTVQGGTISPQLNQMVGDFQKSGLGTFEQLMLGQNMLLSHLAEMKNGNATQNSRTIQPHQKPNVASDVKEITNPWVNEIIDSIDRNDPKTIKRWEVQTTICEETPRVASALPKSGIILLLGDEDDYVIALKAYLNKHGLKVKTINTFLEEEKAKAFIEKTAKEDEITGMITVGNKYYSQKEQDNYCEYILTVVSLLKYITIYHRETKTIINPMFLFHTFLDGKLGMTGTSDDYQYGALNGICKTLAIELMGKAFVKQIDFAPELSVDTKITYLEEELCYQEEVAEIGRFTDGKRYRLTTALTKSEVTKNCCPMTENDVILVSGGARGVTSTCILELAKKVKCKFVLLGRAKIVEENADDEETAKITELKDMKTFLAKRFKEQGHKGSFSVIEKKAKAILAQREMLATFETIKATGNSVYYYSCDVNDTEQMKKVMAKIQQEVGMITGVVHGAGIVADAKIWNKDMKLFRAVFDTKYKGLNNMMDFIDKEKLKVLVMFSSIAGYFGNDGQMDYAAGNEYLDKYAAYVRVKYPNCRALAINWGAWDGGMMDYIYRKALTERGMILIPLEVGANYFANEFLMGLPSQQILINNLGTPTE